METKSYSKNIAWLVIISTFLSLYFDYGVSFQNHNPLSLFLMNLSGACSVFPRGLPFILFITSLGFLLLPIVLLWRLIILVCCMGILNFNNWARKIFVSLCVIHVSTFLFSAIFSIRMRLRQSQTHGVMVNLIFGVLYFFAGFLPILYSIYLMHPKIKEQFK